MNALDPADLRELERLEEGLWRAETRFDREWMERVLAEDFVEFGCSGRQYHREDTLAIPPQHIDAALPLMDFTARPLAEDVVQVTYVSVERSGGKVRRCRRSSIWSRTDHGWRLRFHQGTPLP